MSFKEFLRRINHRQSLENSICDESCTYCEYFDECYDDSINDGEHFYNKVPLVWTYITVIFAFVWLSSFIGISICVLVKLLMQFA